EEEGGRLGPLFNDVSCAACHGTPVTGGSSQITELRAGHRDRAGRFVDAPGGSLVNDRAIEARFQERVPEGESVVAFRLSLSTLGDGFVECVADATLLEIAARERAATRGRVRGQAILVPLAEAPGTLAVGRFGWKCQHASLLSFSADAYLNEMGVTSPFQ